MLIRTDPPISLAFPLVQVERLDELYESYKAQPDCIELIAGMLPGGWSAAGIQRLLRQQNLVQGGGRRGGQDAASLGVDEGTLAALYEQHQDDPQFAAAIADEVGASERKVMKALVGAGLIAKVRHRLFSQGVHAFALHGSGGLQTVAALVAADQPSSAYFATSQCRMSYPRKIWMLNDLTTECLPPMCAQPPKPTTAVCAVASKEA